MAITTIEKRGRLEDAYDASARLDEANSLRAKLRTGAKTVRAALAAGSVKRSRGNGHDVEWFDPSASPVAITPLEIVEMYEALVLEFDEAFNFLSQCARLGIDAFKAELDGFPTSVSPVQNPILLDQTGRFTQLVTQFNLDAEVVNAPVNDSSVFVWMMWHLVPVRQEGQDWTRFRVDTGAQFT